MITHSHFPMNDLVLRLAGGQRDGELIPVKTQKCFLGSDDGTVSESGEYARCAIFRGPNGAAVRSYGDQISVNGLPATVHWLKEGDRIEFSNSMTVEVAQLGWIEDASDKPLDDEHAPEHNLCNEAGQETWIDQDAGPDALDESVNDERDSHNELDNEPEQSDAANQDDHSFQPQETFNQESIVDCQDLDEEQPGDDFEPEVETSAFMDDEENDIVACEDEAFDSPTNDHEFADDEQSHHPDTRLDAIESQLQSMQSQTRFTEERFDRFEFQISSLTDQIDQLVTLAQDPATDSGNPPSESAETTQASSQPSTADTPSTVNDAVDAPDGPSSELESTQDESDPGITEAKKDSDHPVLGEFYSYLNGDDDDERIMTFDSEEDCDSEEPTSDAPSEEENEMDSRLSEMERVFGSELGCTEQQLEEASEAANQESGPEATDEATGESTLESTESLSADEQQFESFTPPTHGQDEESDSFAENPMTESVTPIVPGSLASQLLNDVLADESEAVASDDSKDTEEDATEPTEEPQPPASLSVAEVLDKMKEEGNWQGIPDDDSGSEMPDPSSAPQPLAVDPNVPAPPNNSNGDVNDYMSQLLNRMRGDTEPTSEEPASVVAEEKTSLPTLDTDGDEPGFVAPKNPLRPEEFIPARKAQRIELGPMRALANSTSRQAVQASEQEKLKELGYLQVGIATCSFLMSIYFLLWNSKSLFDIGFLLGLTCIGISGFLGYRFYETMKYNESMELKILGKKQDADASEQSEHDEASAEASAEKPDDSAQPFDPQSQTA